MRGPPPWLAASAVPEVASVLSGTKPAARIRIPDGKGALRRWARRHGLFASCDRDGFAVVSRRASTARRALDLDGRPGRHALGLGLLLGYPPCCCRAAARHGDEGIDAMHRRIASRRFQGRFRAIDPAGYREGRAAVSHVPCSHRCFASVAIAAGARDC